MLTGLRLADTELGMLTALPVDRQGDLPCGFVDVGNDIDNQRTNELLTHAHGDTRSIPGRGEVFCELRKIRRGDIRSRRCADGLQASLAGLYAAHCRFPVLLQLRGYQAVVGIAGGVAPLGQRSIVLRLLQFELHDPPLLVQGVHVHLPGPLGGFYR